MDFGLREDQEAAVDLAARILGDRCTPERLAEVEAGEEWFDRELWSELAAADLLGLCLPEAVGGGGYGFLEMCLLLQEQGRTVAPLPLWPTLVAGATLAEFGDDGLTDRWLPGVVAGDRVLGVALAETGADPRGPTVRAELEGDRWRLSGAKTTVPFAHVADALLVPAVTDRGPVVFVVPGGEAGIELARQDTFNHQPDFHVELDGVVVDGPLGGARSGEVLDWLVDRATVALCAIATGVADRGMRITADYSASRSQFGRPIATFQAVAQRMADAFIDAEAIRLTMLQAATLLSGGRPADAEVAVAKYWASMAGSRVGHAGLHVHGGISIDLDYPIHRYFLWAKQIELTLGSGTEHLARLGVHLADTPA